MHINTEKSWRKLLKDEGGVTAIEYALIAALIAVVIIGAVTLAGEELQNTFETVQQAVANAISGS